MKTAELTDMRTEEENKLPENIQQHLIKLELKTKINNDDQLVFRQFSDHLVLQFFCQLVLFQFSGRLVLLFSDKLLIDKGTEELIDQRTDEELIDEGTEEIIYQRFSSLIN
jgi:hypothetical protein